MAKGALTSAAVYGDKVLAKPEWGIKRVCQSCGALFYDLKRSPILCPGCGAQFDTEQAVRVRRTRSAAPIKEVAPAVVDADDAEDLEEAVIEDLDDEEDEDILEDASDLGDDDDEIEVIKKGEGEGED